MPAPTTAIVKRPSIDAQARALLAALWQARISRPPSLSEMHAIQAIARIETFYSLWPSFAGTKNWGALRDDSGEIRSFATHREGVRSLVEALFSRPLVRASLSSGNADLIAYRLRQSRWPMDSVESYANRLSEASGKLARSFREPKALARRGGLVTEKGKKAAIVGGAVISAAVLLGFASSFFDDDHG